MEQVTSALQKPVNVLVSLIPGPSIDEFAAAGAKQLSVGGALAWQAYGRLTSTAREALDLGRFDLSSDPAGPSAPATEVRKLLVEDEAK